MGKRRSSRELALKFLYQSELNVGNGTEQMEAFLKAFPSQEDVEQYMIDLVDLIRYHQTEIDELLEKCSENWTVSRMTVIDRNTLRIATAELLFRKDVPPKVAIDEALEIAKKFGSEDSPDFVNGVLDRIKKEIEKEPAGPPSGR